MTSGTSGASHILFQIFFIGGHTHFGEGENAELIIHVTCSTLIEGNAAYQQPVAVNFLIVSLTCREVTVPGSFFPAVDKVSLLFYRTVVMPFHLPAIAVRHLRISQRIEYRPGKGGVAVIHFAFQLSVGVIVFPFSHRPIFLITSERLIHSIASIIAEYSVVHVVGIRAFHLYRSAQVIVVCIALPASRPVSSAYTIEMSAGAVGQLAPFGVVVNFYFRDVYRRGIRVIQRS